MHLWLWRGWGQYSRARGGGSRGRSFQVAEATAHVTVGARRERELTRRNDAMAAQATAQLDLADPVLVVGLAGEGAASLAARLADRPEPADTSSPSPPARSAARRRRERRRLPRALDALSSSVLLEQAGAVERAFAASRVHAFLAERASEELRALLLLFLSSHVVLFVGSGRCVDVAWLRALRALHQLKQTALPAVSGVAKAKPALPASASSSTAAASAPTARAATRARRSRRRSPRSCASCSGSSKALARAAASAQAGSHPHPSALFTLHADASCALVLPPADAPLAAAGAADAAEAAFSRYLGLLAADDAAAADADRRRRRPRRTARELQPRDGRRRAPVERCGGGRRARDAARVRGAAGRRAGGARRARRRAGGGGAADGAARLWSVGLRVARAAAPPLLGRRRRRRRRRRPRGEGVALAAALWGR